LISDAAIGGYDAPGLLRTGKRDRLDAIIADHRLDLVGFDGQVLEDTGRRIDALKQLADGLGTGRHVRIVFHQAGIAGHQGRRPETEGQPERCIPRQDAQDYAERQILHVAGRRIRVQHVGLEITLGMLGIVLGTPAAFSTSPRASRIGLPISSVIKRPGARCRLASARQRP
jgi:hypothetical protein